jgi:hypothetical protein
MKTLNDIIPDNEKITILSDEEFSGNIHSGGNAGYAEKELADRIYRTLSDKYNVKIAIFIRNQTSMLESCYKQYIKVGGTKSLKGYLFPPNEHHRRPMFSFDHFNYFDLISYYQELFGDDNVKIFLFEKFKENQLQFLKEFEKSLDIPHYKIEKSDKKNVGMPKNFVYLNKLANKISTRSALNYEISFSLPYLAKLVYLITNKLKKKINFNNSNFLDDDLIAYIQKYYYDKNYKLIQTTDFNKGELKKYNYLS